MLKKERKKGRRERVQGSVGVSGVGVCGDGGCGAKGEGV